MNLIPFFGDRAGAFLDPVDWRSSLQSFATSKACHGLPYADHHL